MNRQKKITFVEHVRQPLRLDFQSVHLLEHRPAAVHRLGLAHSMCLDPAAVHRFGLARFRLSISAFLAVIESGHMNFNMYVYNTKISSMQQKHTMQPKAYAYKYRTSMYKYSIERNLP